MENQNFEWADLLWVMARDITNHKLGAIVASNKDLDGMSKVSLTLFSTFACIAINADRLIKDKKNKTSVIYDGENDLVQSLGLLKNHFDDSLLSKVKFIKKSPSEIN